MTDAQTVAPEVDDTQQRLRATPRNFCPRNTSAPAMASNGGEPTLLQCRVRSTVVRTAACNPEQHPWRPRIRTLRESKAGPHRETRGRPAPRHKRALGACSVRASALIEAVVRGGRRFWVPRWRRTPDCELLLSLSSQRRWCGAARTTALISRRRSTGRLQGRRDDHAGCQRRTSAPRSTRWPGPAPVMARSTLPTRRPGRS